MQSLFNSHNLFDYGDDVDAVDGNFIMKFNFKLFINMDIVNPRC